MGEINYRDRALNSCIADLTVMRSQLEIVRREMIDTPHSDAPCNTTALQNLWLALEHLGDAERLIETAKRYDPDAEVPEEKPPCYLCANWQRTCKADTCHFIPA